MYKIIYFLISIRMIYGFRCYETDTVSGSDIIMSCVDVNSCMTVSFDDTVNSITVIFRSCGLFNQDVLMDEQDGFENNFCGNLVGAAADARCTVKHCFTDLCNHEKNMIPAKIFMYKSYRVSNCCTLTASIINIGLFIVYIYYFYINKIR